MNSLFRLDSFPLRSWFRSLGDVHFDWISLVACFFFHIFPFTHLLILNTKRSYSRGAVYMYKIIASPKARSWEMRWQQRVFISYLLFHLPASLVGIIFTHKCVLFLFCIYLSPILSHFPAFFYLCLHEKVSSHLGNISSLNKWDHTRLRWTISM